MLELNHGFSKRGLSTEIHFLNGLFKQLCIDFLKVDDDLDANVPNALIILCKYDQSICNNLNTLVVKFNLIAKNYREMLKKEL